MGSRSTPAPQSLADCATIIRDNNIHTVECLFTDTWGIPRGKRLPVEQFLSGAGFSMAAVAFSWNFRSEIEPTPWAEMDSEFADMRAVPDLQSFRLAGWSEGMASVMGDMHDGVTGEPIALDGRGMVKKTIAEYRALGY